MSVSLQADSTLPQGYILVNGERVASVSTTGGLSATLAANTVTTSSLVSGSVTTEKIAPGAVTAAKMAGGQSGDAPVYGCRAWVNFNGFLSADGVNNSVNGQPVFIRASGNVNSVIRVTNGVYRVIFTVPMPDENYATVGTSRDSTTFGWLFSVSSGTSNSPYTTVVTTTAVEVEVNGGSPFANTGTDYISVLVFR